ncbi:glycosyltransferase [Microbacterium caowuchunii]|uniref:glycosyltransferase n=1 Tax=Microbacterium caowuchunii TaxID=2614638 RepID=UPI001CD79E98|nr:glycosyltransferase [Microbacterium caowuchunii]
MVWNPFVATAPIKSNPFLQQRDVVLDLLDDWTVHFAFDTIKDEVDDAYRKAFANATHITANAEGTAALARRYGRDDVILLPNGCDPDRFSSSSKAQGRTTVGYVGKIGERVDLELVIDTAKALPDVRFVFAGPVLDAHYSPALASISNIELLGDVHYDDVPALLQSFDVGWVPHRVGRGEVGGDVIKTYEYRAAGLPALSTPIVGAGERGLSGVVTLDRSRHAAWIADRVLLGPRIPREEAPIPPEATWRNKATRILRLLGLEHQD